MGDIIKPKHGPEWHIQKALTEFLQARGWVVEVMHGNAFQRGIPDLYLFRKDWGARWVDVKNPKKYSFTKNQRIKWPFWEKMGIGIWILTAATQHEYDKLFKAPNWRDYWKSSWEMPTDDQIDAMIDAMWEEDDGDQPEEPKAPRKNRDSSWYEF
jgi:hypothetical protein